MLCFSFVKTKIMRRTQVYKKTLKACPLFLAVCHRSTSDVVLSIQPGQSLQIRGHKQVAIGSVLSTPNHRSNVWYQTIYSPSQKYINVV